MKCDVIQKELSAYLDGEIGETLRVELEAHLAGCASCRQQLERLEQVAAGVAALPRLAPTPQFLNQVHRKLATDGEPMERRSPAWVDALFQPVWLKLPLEALALVAVAATILVMQKPQSQPQLAAASPRADRRTEEANKVEVAVAPVVAAKPETPAPAPVLEDVARDEPKAEEPVEVAAVPPAPVQPESAVDRLSPSTVEQRKDMAFNLPAPSPVTPVVAPPDVAAAVEESKGTIGGMDKSVRPTVDHEVEQSVTNAPAKVFVAPIVIVHAGDFTKVRRQVETAAVQMGGQILSRTESQLNGKSGVVYTFQVQLPPGQVVAFRSQFTSAKASAGARSRMGTPAVVQGELPAASTDTTVRSAIANQEPVAAGKTKESAVVVEVQVVQPE